VATSQKKTQGRAEMKQREHPAQATAKSVIASVNVDRGPPLLVQQKQNCRMNVPAWPMRSTNEIDDRKSPGDGNVDAPDSDAPVEQPRNGREQNHHQCEAIPKPISQRSKHDYRWRSKHAIAWNPDRPKTNRPLKRCALSAFTARLSFHFARHG